MLGGLPEKYQNCLYIKSQGTSSTREITLSDKRKQSNPYNLNNLTFSVIGKEKKKKQTKLVNQLCKINHINYFISQVEIPIAG